MRRLKKALCILQVLSHLLWGAVHTTQLCGVTEYLFTTNDYGCEAYSSATPTILQTLDSDHNEAQSVYRGFQVEPLLRVENHSFITPGLPAHDLLGKTTKDFGLSYA